MCDVIVHYYNYGMTCDVCIVPVDITMTWRNMGEKKSLFSWIKWNNVNTAVTQKAEVELQIKNFTPGLLLPPSWTRVQTNMWHVKQGKELLDWLDKKIDPGNAYEPASVGRGLLTVAQLNCPSH